MFLVILIVELELSDSVEKVRCALATVSAGQFKVTGLPAVNETAGWG